MSQQPSQPADTPETPPPHRNRGLFSDNFLGQHIPELTGDDLAQAQSTQREILALCAKAESRAGGTREANVEKILIRPVLELLGFCYHPQPSLPTGASAETPDYALFASEESEQAAAQHEGQPQFFEPVLALAEAKNWDRPLSATAKKARSGKDRRHPGKQTRDYLYESGVRWGILTNGRLWRLYEREASRGENYYEVDLLALAGGDVQVWRYFYLFFRRQAFERDADGRCVLDRWLAGSRDYALGLTKRLRGNVYDALRCLMEGFFAAQGNRFNWDRDWQSVRDASLVLLYRLLFVLYAEARELLPVGNPGYRDNYSLQRHKAQIAEQEDRGGYDRFGSGLWNWLRNDLFQFIDQGNPGLGVPQYNGGLFRAEAWPLLHDPNIRLTDGYLAQAIDLLARSEADGAKGFVDYSELGVRELGNIYEGLLEMRPHMAVEPMLEARRGPKDKGASVIPEATAMEKQKAWSRRTHAPRYQPGEVYLLTDRGERKQTGSYYTPEYIVNYIVEHTLGPLVAQCARKVAESRPAFEKRIRKLEKVIAERGDAVDASAERAAVERLKLESLEPYFELKVLDPAMGSGHFLVGAADFITDAILTDPNHIPPGGADGEDEALYYKRRVVERCLFGVDFNPLAVELAKLSLWLHTVQKGRALSFLDHHLRCGNSLIGARIERDLSKEPPIFNKGGKQTNKDSAQLILGYYDTLQSRHLEGFLSVLAEIEGTPTTSAESEGHKNHLYKTLDELRDPYRQVANLWLSPYFVPAASLVGVTRHPDAPLPVTAQQYHDAVEALSAGAESREWAALTVEPWFRGAQKVAAEWRFFHWELEFPEVWFARGCRKHNPGFDAVIGNPPWLGVRTGEIDEGTLSFVKRALGKTGQLDLAALFLDLACEVACNLGWVGAVVPKRIATNEIYEPLRRLLAEARRLESAIDLDVAFEDVNNDVVIIVSAPETSDLNRCFFGRRSGREALETWEVSSGLAANMPFCIFPLNTFGEQVTVAAEIGRHAILLGSFCEIVRGVECGMNHPAISREQAPASIALLDHLDVNRYEVVHSGWYVDSKAIPQETLKPLSLYVTVPKLLVRFLSSTLVCGRDDVGYASTNLLYHLTSSSNLSFLLAVLCSSPLDLWYRTAFQNEEIKFPHVQKSHLQRVPIRRIHFTTPAEERAALVEELKRMYREWLGSREEKP